MDFQNLLRFGVENNASDVHIQAGLPPRLRIGGHVRLVNLPALSDDEVRQFIESIAPPRMVDDLDQHLYRGMDFSYAIEGVCRFRCSAPSTAC